MKQFLSDNNLVGYYDGYFSIETELINNKVTWTDGPKGKYFSDEVWNPVKATICDKYEVDIMYDNSVAYQSAFDEIDTVFCLVIDK